MHTSVSTTVGMMDSRGAALAALQEELGTLRATVRAQEEEIEQLTHANTELKRRLEYERAYPQDTKPRNFKSWLKKQPSSAFRDRFLADPLVPVQGTRAHYQYYLRRLQCPADEQEDFVRLWKLMLLG